MNSKNKMIIALLLIGITLSIIVQFVIVPRNNEKKQKYIADQLEPTTHDLESILEFKNPYIGDSSNVINLFYNLPLADRGVKFEIKSKDYALIVNYLDTVWNIGREKVDKALIYNSVAAFALIGNLELIAYNFSGDAYYVTRIDIELIFGKDLASLLTKEKWQSTVQDRLQDANFIQDCMQEAIHQK